MIEPTPTHFININEEGRTMSKTSRQRKAKERLKAKEAAKTVEVPVVEPMDGTPVLCQCCGGHHGEHAGSCPLDREDYSYVLAVQPTRPSEADTMGNGNKPKPKLREEDNAFDVDPKPSWADCHGEKDFEAKMEAWLAKLPGNVQHGGTHYKDMAIQPVEYCQRNKLGFCEASAVKYLTRHSTKGKAEDVKKALHFCQLLLSIEYGINATVDYGQSAST